MSIDLDALDKLADEAMLPMSVKTMRMHKKAVREFRIFANPATIKALIALVKDAWAERDQLEQNIIDASNGRFPPQGQADPDDEIDGLAHMVYGLRKERAFLARNGKGEG